VRLKHNSRTVKQLLLTQTKLKHREIPELKKQQVCLKNICIHSHSQLSEVLDIFSRKESVVLIARISPIAIKDSKAKIGLVNEIYKQATKNNYSVFRLGEERIIVVHSSVKVEGILTEDTSF
jgi:predicted transcriptional regulator